ncbi:hypothetical protein F5Y17DRAFT_450505 [Xylariaceae sp. FL0594]|nr:hypothetical protein F5Y17DRAFT_450505 [Xylariaceae sp. FL0594]
MDQARRKAMERGTYVETLPPPLACGCCPGEDRPRQKKRKCDTTKKSTVRNAVRNTAQHVKSGAQADQRRNL